jgi:hypothetical protein
MDCHEGFFVFRPLTGKQNLMNLCDLCASAVSYSRVILEIIRPFLL